MPFRSQAQRKYLFAAKPSIAREFAAKTPAGAKLPSRAKNKPVVGVDNKMKGSYGETILQKGKQPVVKINVQKHKGNKAELADTIHHELMHAKHPKMKEKAVYKQTARDMREMSASDKDKLVSKLRTKALNYKSGAVKRKLKLGRAQTKPGELISKARAMTPKRAAFMGGV